MLEVGRRLGPYEIVSALGSGGMGEVYRGRDTKLNRDVAIKILPDTFANDDERVTRFAREAQTLAALNHPHIAQIYAVEDRALVMELVDGDDLSTRIAQGAVPLSEALSIAQQIAQALEAAHAAGVVHRDLKPANIKVRADGTVKVLDFGLAKPGAAGPSRAGGVETANSPTITAGATRDGVLLGTAAYMSPEQARGKAVDHRTDLWAFGCVLYEMLTGRQAFGGETISDSLANVLSRDVDWSALPTATPTAIRRLLRRCLERDLKSRQQSAGDARVEIDEAMRGGAESAEMAPGSRRSSAASLIVAAVTASAIVAASVWFAIPRESTGQPNTPMTATRFMVPIPPGTQLARNYPALAIAPDGRSFVAAVAGSNFDQTQRLELRRMDRSSFESLRGAERGGSPFFFGDSRRVGFVDYQAWDLKIIDLETREVRKVCTLPPGEHLGFSAGPDDTIVFSGRAPGGAMALMRVPAAGGVPTSFLEADPKKGEIAFAWPQVMPDGDHVVFSIRLDGGTSSGEIISLRTRNRQRLIDNARYTQYQSAGYLTFFRPSGPSTGAATGDLMAVSFDAATRKVSGQPFRVVPEIRSSEVPIRSSEIANDGFDGAFSRDTLILISSRAGRGSRSLVWADRTSHVSRADSANRLYRQPDLSKDGTQVLFGSDDAIRDLWMYDLRRDVATPLTRTREEEETPRWSPDGRHVIFAAERGGRRVLVRAPLDGSAPEEQLWSFPDHMHVNGSTSDGRVIYLNVRNPASNEDLWTYSFADRKATPFLVTPASEFGAEPSPDGRWVAYVSDESGRREVYLRNVQTAGKVQVSRDGGLEPAWSRDGHEVFFRNLLGTQLFGVTVNPTPSGVQIGAPSVLVSQPFASGNRDRFYAVGPDSKQFLLIRSETEVPTLEIEVTLNIAGELRRLAAEATKQ